jgi:hypothetical protein
METKRLNNYKIDFYTEEEWNEPINFDSGWGRVGENILQYQEENKQDYVGLVLDINEELLDDIIDNSDFIDEQRCNCGERDTCYYCNRIWDSSKLELFQTLSDLPYCAITKLI